MELSKERMLEIAERKEKCVKCDTEKHICIACDNFVCANKVWREEVAFYEQIRELLQADTEGRLVVLPCKVGEKVFAIYTSIKGTNPIICRVSFEESMIPLFGKYVFLTREEAEAALEKMRGGKK